MTRKENNKDKDLTEKEQQLLHEMIETYQGLKMMSRFVKWLAFILFLFIIDFARLMDALENILTHLKRWLTKVKCTKSSQKTPEKKSCFVIIREKNLRIFLDDHTIW